MSILDQFFAISLLVQTLHSIEELSTGFHKKWYLFKMPFWLFLLFEIVFEVFWISVYFLQNFTNHSYFEAFFLVLMFANGIQHMVWAGSVRKYVPGLVTAPLHVVIFLTYYFIAVF